MRVTGGFLRGRQLETPAGHRTHPMSDKARAAVFNALGDVTDLTVFDPFGGTGALSIEALSRGAASAVAIDQDRLAAAAMRENAHNFNLNEQMQVIRANASTWSDHHLSARFDLVFCDPPYDKLRIDLLNKLARHVKVDGLLVLSWPGNISPPEIFGFKNLQRNQLGDLQLVFYRKSDKVDHNLWQETDTAPPSAES